MKVNFRDCKRISKHNSAHAALHLQQDDEERRGAHADARVWCCLRARSRMAMGVQRLNLSPPERVLRLRCVLPARASGTPSAEERRG